MLELMIVVGILLVVAAMAIPKLMTTLADVKLRGAINSASGIIQQARMMAIKDDKLRQVQQDLTRAQADRAEKQAALEIGRASCRERV